MPTPENVVLVVEDNAVNSQLSCKILSHMQIDAVVRDNGEDAVEWCRQHVPRLILMDISLPGMDGLEVTRQLRTFDDFQDVPIIALTAHALSGWEEKTRQAGCTAYLSKPIRPADLMTAVRQYLPNPTA